MQSLEQRSTSSWFSLKRPISANRRNQLWLFPQMPQRFQDFNGLELAQDICRGQWSPRRIMPLMRTGGLGAPRRWEKLCLGPWRGWCHRVWFARPPPFGMRLGLPPWLLARGPIFTVTLLGFIFIFVVAVLFRSRDVFFLFRALCGKSWSITNLKSNLCGSDGGCYIHLFFVFSL